MTSLSAFSTEERDLLIRLPLQVGMLIASAEEDDAVEESDQEMVALQKTLNLLPGLYEHAPVVQEILKETSENSAQWPKWQQNLSTVEGDCKQAMVLLNNKASSAEAKAYRSVLLEVADTVARAAGVAGAVEVRHTPDSGLMKTLHDMLKPLGFFKTPSDANISTAERELIGRLDMALQS
jgi:hypothetical protein